MDNPGPRDQGQNSGKELGKYLEQDKTFDLEDIRNNKGHTG